MPRDENICWFTPLSWQKILALFSGSQGGFNSSAVQGVSQAVVSGNSFALPGTVEGMVTQPVTGLSTGRAWSIRSKNWMAEAVAEGGHKLRRTEEKA